jgi:hypothetical protein
MVVVGFVALEILWQLQVSKGKQSRNIVAIASVKRKKKCRILW